MRVKPPRFWGDPGGGEDGREGLGVAKVREPRLQVSRVVLDGREDDGKGLRGTRGLQGH